MKKHSFFILFIIFAQLFFAQTDTVEVFPEKYENIFTDKKENKLQLSSKDNLNYEWRYIKNNTLFSGVIKHIGEDYIIFENVTNGISHDESIYDLQGKLFINEKNLNFSGSYEDFIVIVQNKSIIDSIGQSNEIPPFYDIQEFYKNGDLLLKSYKNSKSNIVIEDRVKAIKYIYDQEKNLIGTIEGNDFQKYKSKIPYNIYDDIEVMNLGRVMHFDINGNVIKIDYHFNNDYKTTEYILYRKVNKEKEIGEIYNNLNCECKGAFINQLQADTLIKQENTAIINKKDENCLYNKKSEMKNSKNDEVYLN